MRNTSLISLLVTVFYLGQAQSTDIQVISSTASSYILNNVQLDCTLGEISIQYLENPATILTLGYHQPDYDLTTSTNLPMEMGAIEAYPNPVIDVLHLRMNLLSSQTGVIELFDLEGIKIWSKPFDGKIINEELFLGDYPPGHYYFSIIMNQQHINEPIKIVKIQ